MEQYITAEVNLSKKLVDYLEENVKPKAIDETRGVLIYPFQEAYESTGRMDFDISYEDATIFSILDSANEEVHYIEIKTEPINIEESFTYFASYLLDNKEGEVITEENLQKWLSESENQRKNMQ